MAKEKSIELENQTTIQENPSSIETTDVQQTKTVQEDLFEEFAPLVPSEKYPIKEVKAYNEVVAKYNKLETAYKRAIEDIKSFETETQVYKNEIDELKENMIEQDFIITILDKFNRNKITEADLDMDVPEGVQIRKISDYVKYSQVYKKYWKDTTMREYLKNNWEKRGDISLIGNSLDFNPTSPASSNNISDVDIIKSEVQRRCALAKVPVHSTEGTQIKIQVRNEFSANPDGFRLNFQKMEMYGGK